MDNELNLQCAFSATPAVLSLISLTWPINSVIGERVRDRIIMTTSFNLPPSSHCELSSPLSSLHLIATMSALGDVVRFCFPNPGSIAQEDLFPEDNYHQNRDRREGGGGGGRGANGGDSNDPTSSPSQRPGLHHSSNSFSHRFMRPEQDNLTKGVLPLTFGNAVRHYLADWVLAAVLW